MNLQNFEIEIRKRARMDNAYSRSIPRVDSSDMEAEFVLASSCNPEKISSIFSSLNSQKADILKIIGFHGLLKIPFIEKLNDHLSLWLYQRFEISKMCWHLEDGVDLYITDADVFLIFGIPFEGRPVNFGLNQSFETVSAFREKLLNHTSSCIINMAVLEEIVAKDYGPIMSAEQIDAFIIAIVLISMHYLLAPEQKPCFPSHLIKNFLPDVVPKEINWAQYVLWTIGRSAFDTRLQISSGSKSISMFGCTHLLQVYYLDNLNFGPCSPYHIILPRASAYSSGIMNQLIVSAASRISNDKLVLFRTKEVRPGTDVCYTRGWMQHVDMQTELQNISQDDFVIMAEMLYDAINLLDTFAPHLNGCNATRLTTATELLPIFQSCYLKFKSTVNDKMPSMLSKSALIVKNGIVTSYPQHIPHPVVNNSFKLLPTGAIEEHSRTVIHSHTSTAISDFPEHSSSDLCSYDTSFKHQDVTFTNKAKCFFWLSNPSLPSDELNRNWIVFTSPKEVLICGHAVRKCLKSNGIFDIDFVDAIMNVWNYLDGKHYKGTQTQKRWRHFLPPSFADMVIQNSDYLNCDATRSNFIGQHLSYNVGDCQQIIVPVCDNSNTWSTYIWDFKHKTITVLDPLLMKSPKRRLRVKHQSPVFKLHEALLACCKSFFHNFDIDGNGWIDIYVTDVGHKSKMQDSGLYAVHYARALCDAKIIFQLIDEASVSLGRAEILYHILKCEANIGYKPESIMKDI